ncbi:hypothetical protein RIF29_19135 [Crotalaria pallida]|uniref:Uncharacterized protein n=1 Tax=Crotalaria pallida TaxID=3830 RepID=A0AAN9F1G3_CROPI
MNTSRKGRKERDRGCPPLSPREPPSTGLLAGDLRVDHEIRRRLGRPAAIARHPPVSVASPSRFQTHKEEDGTRGFNGRRTLVDCNQAPTTVISSSTVAVNRGNLMPSLLASPALPTCCCTFIRHRWSLQELRGKKKGMKKPIAEN